MSQSQETRQPQGRMLALVMLFALLLVIGIPQGENAFADGTGHNDTLTRSIIVDSTEVGAPEKELAPTAELSFGDWLLKMAIMLL